MYDVYVWPFIYLSEVLCVSFCFQLDNMDGRFSQNTNITLNGPVTSSGLAPVLVDLSMDNAIISLTENSLILEKRISVSISRQIPAEKLRRNNKAVKRNLNTVYRVLWNRFSFCGCRLFCSMMALNLKSIKVKLNQNQIKTLY